MKKVFALVAMVMLVALASGCAMNDYMNGSDHSSHSEDSRAYGGHGGHTH